MLSSYRVYIIVVWAMQSPADIARDAYRRPLTCKDFCTEYCCP